MNRTQPDPLASASRIGSSPTIRTAAASSSCDRSASRKALQ